MYKFKIVQKEQFIKDCKSSKLFNEDTPDEILSEIWQNIKKPKKRPLRLHEYLFFLPMPSCLREKESVTIPTGIIVNPAEIVYVKDCKELYIIKASCEDNGHLLIKVGAKDNVSMQAGQKFAIVYFTPYGLYK